MNSTKAPRARWDRRGLFASWLAVGVAFGGLTVLSRVIANPLDDPDPAHQRPGYLDVSGPPYAAAPLASNLPRPASRSVIFFTRPALEPALIGALQGDAVLAATAQLVVVVCGGLPPVAAAPPATVLDESAACPAGVLYRMRTPRDGGSPVGYALVGSSGLVRYTTLDPDAEHRLSEVETLARAVP